MIHGQNIKDIKKFECDACGKIYSMKKNLNQHKKEKHFDTNHNIDFIEKLGTFSEISCEQCDQTFKRSSHLNRHMASVHCEMKKFQCLFCEKIFPRKDNLKRHIKLKHP